jgi:glycosyltransferase involved in cell wall biosynthesis
MGWAVAPTKLSLAARKHCAGGNGSIPTLYPFSGFGRSMRIALITPGFSADPMDWAIPALQNLATALAREHDLYVFSLRYPSAGEYQWDDFNHQATGGARRGGLASINIWRKTVEAIARQHQQTPFDVLHAFWADEPGLVAQMTASQIKRPIIVSIGGGELTYLPDINYGTQGSFIRKRIVQRSLKSADAVTAGSAYQLNLAQKQGVDKGKAHLIPLGVDTSQFQPAPTPDWERPTIVQAASLTPVKNQTLLLETLALVKKGLPNIQLLLAGNGPSRSQLENLARTLHLENNIRWEGEVAYESMAQIFQQGHLYVQTSRHESQGMSVLEAMACGLPVVGTPVGVTAELAHLPATNEANELATQIVEILSDTADYENHRRRARQRIVDDYSLDQTVDRFLDIYTRLSSLS